MANQEKLTESINEIDKTDIENPNFKEISQLIKKISGADVAEEEIKRLHEKVKKIEEIYDLFFESKELQESAEELKEVVEESLPVLYLAMVSENENEWKLSDIDNYIEILPDKLIFKGRSFFADQPKFLSTFFGFLYNQNKISEESYTSFRNKIESVKNKFVEIFDDLSIPEEDLPLLKDLNKITSSFEIYKDGSNLTEEQKSLAQSIIPKFFIEIKKLNNVNFFEIKERHLEKFCLNTIPEKVNFTEMEIHALVPVMTFVFILLDKLGHISNGTSLAVKLQKLHEQLLKNATDSTRFSIEKALFNKAISEGVDMNNEDEVKAFFEKIMNDKESFFKENFSDMGIGSSETIVRSNPKIGRNDPCVCGSGKKYKKCCGKA